MKDTDSSLEPRGRFKRLLCLALAREAARRRISLDSDASTSTDLSAVSVEHRLAPTRVTATTVVRKLESLELTTLNPMGKSKPAGPKSVPPGSEAVTQSQGIEPAVQQVIGQIASLHIDQIVTLKKALDGIQNAAGGKPSSGQKLANRNYYTDPKSGKTFRIRRKARPSKNERIGNELVSACILSLQKVTDHHGLSHEGKDQYKVIATNKVLALKDLPEKPRTDIEESLYQLKEARAQLKAVKSSIALKRGKGSKNPSIQELVESGKLPTFNVQTDSWADISD